MIISPKISLVLVVMVTWRSSPQASNHIHAFSFEPSARVDADQSHVLERMRKAQLDQWASKTSRTILHAVPPPQAILQKENTEKQSYTPNSKIKFVDVSSDNLIPTSGFLPLMNMNETGEGKSDIIRNRSSKFFSLDTSAQSLNLGVSFTVPFVSIPTESLLSLGQTATTALTDLFSFNLPSVAMAVIIIGSVMLFLPKVMNVLLSFLTQFGFPGDFKFPQEYEEVNPSSYTTYMRTLEVSPFTSILNQIDEAMKEYNLDSTSCMQRVVCSYVSETEKAIIKGKAEPTHLIIKGLLGSSWLENLIGNNALTQALHAGKSEEHSCSREFPKCPFSLPGIVKLLSQYVKSTS